MPPRAAGPLEIELRGATYSYRDEEGVSQFAVAPVDLRVESGRILFIVGGNGSGKSTLVKMILGLYEPTAGSVLLNGDAIEGAERREWYRQHFSVVFADFYLFPDIAGIGVDNARERAQKYLALLQLDKKVRIEGDTFSTTSLSSGQRKRLALVGAYLEDRPIYVFDEWAADQDPNFKNVFYTQLLPELKARGKAVVVVSHDDRYFEVADEIIKMEDGRIVKDEEIGLFLHRLMGGRTEL